MAKELKNDNCICVIVNPRLGSNRNGLTERPTHDRTISNKYIDKHRLKNGGSVLRTTVYRKFELCT